MKRVVILIFILAMLLPLNSFADSNGLSNEEICLKTIAVQKISNANFLINRQTALDGEWEFFWQQWLISDGDTSASDAFYLNHPKPWTKHIDSEYPYPGGYASYRTTLQDFAVTDMLILSIPDFGGAYKAYVNGELVAESGHISKNLKQIKTSREVNVTTFQAEGDLDIILEVASTRMAGLYKAPIITTKDKYDSMQSNSRIQFYFCAGMLCVLCSVCFLFYLFMEVRVYGLWLCAILFTISIRYALFNMPPELYSTILPEFQYENIEYILIFMHYSGKFFFLGFVNRYFTLRIPQISFVLAALFYSMLYLVFVFSPPELYKQYFYQMLPVFSVIPLFYILHIIVKRMRQKPLHALIATMQAIIFEICIGVELFYFWGLSIKNYTSLTVVGTGINAALFLFVFGRQVASLYRDNESIIRMREAVAESNTRLLMSQIRPHFLYNTLNAICALCRTDPKLAEQGIVYFSKYLKSNMKAIEVTEPILFQEEYVHVESYVWIEKLRLEDRLNVVYDIQETDFYIPLLTLEPLVENAIRHGISKKMEGGTVTIRTYRDFTNYYIAVEDDGVGFEDGETSLYRYENEDSVGIKNVIARLKMMVNGTLQIESTKNVGTKIQITLPVKDNHPGPFELVYQTKDGENIRCIL